MPRRHAGSRASLLVYFDPLDTRCLALRPLVVLAAERLADEANIRVGAVRCNTDADTDALCREHRVTRWPSFHAVGANGFRRALGEGGARGETDFRLPELLLDGTLAAEADFQKRRKAHDEL